MARKYLLIRLVPGQVQGKPLLEETFVISQLSGEVLQRPLSISLVVGLSDLNL